MKSKVLFVLFIYDNDEGNSGYIEDDEGNTGYIEGIYTNNDEAHDAGGRITKATDSDYYVVARKLK